MAIFTMPLMFSSCGDDEPSTPEAPEITDPELKPNDSGNSSSGDEEIQGSKILGTWYYLSPDKALKLTVRFTSEKGYSYVTFRHYVCYISVESEFPYYHEDYDNTWKYENSKWEITRLAISKALFSSATITQVFDDEMWLDFEYGVKSERLKFKRIDPGNPQKSTDKELAQDGIFGKYVWKAAIGRYNMTFQFTGAEKAKETSDSEVWVDGVGKRLKESTLDAIYSNGLLRLDWSKSLIASEAGNSYFVVVKESDRKLKLYNPFSPDVTYTFTR